LDYDPETKRVTGIKGVNTQTNEAVSITARSVFLNASTIPTAMILLNSKSASMPNGLANSSGQVGHNLMDHIICARTSGRMAGMEDKYYYGRRPNGIYIPRFRNHTEEGEGFVRGFGFQGRVGRSNWQGSSNSAGIGADYKTSNQTPGDWWVSLVGFAEILPNFENHVRLHENKTDKWGFPVPILDAKHRDNEIALVRQAARDAQDMLRQAGCTNVSGADPETDIGTPPGDGIHEMGTARMGRDSKTSVLNGFNQSWDVPNLFVTDGSFMTSGGCQNPSITYMAFSARAADHAAKLMKAGEI
jgi:choline dehydrogenase-like flavoprotein